MDTNGYARISILLFIVVLFIIFISMDAVKALKKRAHWVPGDVLVLSALTIQLLTLLGGESALLKEDLDNRASPDVIKNDLWMIHSSRVMLCVVIAYLLPSMASRNSEDSWGKLAALVITIFLHMTSELYIIHGTAGDSFSSSSFIDVWPHTKDIKEAVFVGSAAIISISFITLILLLGCANIASRAIKVIFAQMIPFILSRHDYAQPETFRWRIVEDEVLRAWIVARAYSPEYIISRSALSSSTATIVTTQILISIIGWIFQGPMVLFHSTIDLLKFTVSILQCIFIMIGWAIIGWRWAMAAGFYTRWQSGTWRSVVRAEDFWTRQIRELLQAREPKLEPAERLNKNIKRLVSKQPVQFQMPWLILYLMLLLQWLMVLFSKICWVVSLMMFHNKCMSKLFSFILSKYEANEFEKFSNYEKVLKGLEMLGETPQSLSIANRKSFAKAKQLIIQGKHDGESNCEELVEFLALKKTEAGLDLSFCNPRNRPTELKYLWQSIPELLEVEKHFIDASKPSWKMTAVSLISIAIQLSPIKNYEPCSNTTHDFPPKSMKDILKAYSQVWEIIDFVDEQAEGIMGEAADKLFLSLKTKVDKGVLPNKKFLHPKPECITSAINELAEESKKKTETPRGVHLISTVVDKLGLKSKMEKPEVESDDWKSAGGYDSMDWKEVAAGIAVYKLCKSISCDPNADAMELLEELQCSLADIIYASIIKAKSTLASKSFEWARDSNENNIGKALYIVGKAKAVMKKLKPSSDNSLAIVAIN